MTLKRNILLLLNSYLILNFSLILMWFQIVIFVKHELIDLFVKLRIWIEFYNKNNSYDDDMSPIRKWEIICSEKSVNLRDLDQYKNKHT